MKSFSESYRNAGVDITAGYKSVELMKSHIARTNVPGVVSGIGGFGGLFAPDLTGMKEPVLVSGTDGCGTKVKMAILMDKHDTIGIDAVAMCVNDIICCGAKPLFFLDYIACGKNVPEKIASIVSGVAEGCVQSGCALIGGETAEHPGMMPVEDYDLAGFAVGVVDKEKIIDNGRMQAGDVVIALASSGIHSNGFSLCRKVFDIDNNNPALYVPCDALGGKTIAETLLTPTRIYVKSILALMQQVDVKGVSHITGGGFYENIPRSIPDGLGAKIDKQAVRVLPIFDLIAKTGNIPERDMFNTFNMGVGMSVVVPAGQVELALEILKAHGDLPAAKTDYRDGRTRVRFKECSPEEKARLIAEDPAYGRVVCRCETITEGEILNALREEIPDTTIDGVKRRCGAGMGRCQGGFCGPRVLELISKTLGISPLDVLQDKAGTNVLLCETKQEENHHD